MSPGADVVRRRAAVVSVVAVVVLLLVGWWATARGYIPPLTGATCDDMVYPGDPDFDTLVDEYGLPPYCARDYVGGTWL